MNVPPPQPWPDQLDDPPVCIDERIDPLREEAFWRTVFWCEPYFRGELDYEDYAPAYCVGYVGFAQYGGSHADAERSLCANWLRIRGASRLSLDEALQAIRAAWRHAEKGTLAEADAAERTEGSEPGAARHALQPEAALAA